MRIVNDQVPTPFRDIDLEHAAAAELPRVRDQGACSCRCTCSASRARWRAASARSRRRPRDRARRRAAVGPLHRLGRSRSYVRTVLSDAGRTDDFRLLAERALPRRHRPRHVRADRARRRGLGRRPDLHRRARLDGAADGLHAHRRSRTASWSTAASSRPPTSTSRSRRARSSSSSSTRWCRTSTTSRSTIPTMFGTRVRRVSDMGFPKIGYQTFKLLAYQRLHEMARHWEERYPGVDIVLIEPEPDDELMFETSILNYSSRVEVAAPRLRVGHASSWPRTTTSSASVCRPPRHRDLRHARAQGRHATSRPRSEKTRAWRRILEQTTGALLRQSAGASPRRAARSRSAYFSLTTLRLTFSVGVSSPVSCERSWSRIEELLDLLDLRVASR